MLPLYQGTDWSDGNTALLCHAGGGNARMFYVNVVIMKSEGFEKKDMFVRLSVSPSVC